MAKVSMIQREKKRQKTVLRLSKKVAELKETARQGYKANDGSAWDALEALAKLPRNASRSRLQRRCNSCGRPHAVYRKFGLCRICLRKYAMLGLVPGVVKSSW